MKYMLMFFADEDAWMALPNGDRDEAIQRIGAWYGIQVRAGHIVQGCRLQGKNSATTVRLGAAGRSEKPIVTDGPFVEAKETIGSYAIVEVGNLEEAIAVAESWPVGGGIEIRRVAEG
jgi:hypothetical protein